MCGIVGYLGRRPAAPLLLEGLRRLEYRGYDSAGLVVLENGVLERVRAVGPVEQLAERLQNIRLTGHAGLGHTRWATHGEVTEANAHPHLDCTRKIAIVHNGIIENYAELRAALGPTHRYTSLTDSEIFAHLLEAEYRGDLVDAVRRALGNIRGTSAFVVLHADHPRLLVAARAGCPLIIGVAADGALLASDPSPLGLVSRRAIFLDNGQVAAVSPTQCRVFSCTGSRARVRARRLTTPRDAGTQSPVEHFLLKEILEQPSALRRALEGRMRPADGQMDLEDLALSPARCRALRRVILVACGTAQYASMLGASLIERLSSVPASAEIASEFVSRDPKLSADVLVLAVSQSGETADTLAAARLARERGATVCSLVNVEGSTLARETMGTVLLRAGPERSVASTKAYTNMVAVLTLVALWIGRMHGLSVSVIRRNLVALRAVPAQMDSILHEVSALEPLAHRYARSAHCLFLGRGMQYPVALEGALKLTELSYVHGHGTAAAEMKHGLNALLGPELPVVTLSPRNALVAKMRNAMAEVRARGSPVVAITTAGDEETSAAATDTFTIPPTDELLEPLLTVIPLQYFAYASGVALGRDIDRPRNLAKSVTVE